MKNLPIKTQSAIDDVAVGELFVPPEDWEDDQVLIEYFSPKLIQCPPAALCSAPDEDIGYVTRKFQRVTIALPDGANKYFLTLYRRVK